MFQLVVGVPYLFAFVLAPGRVVLALWVTWLALTVMLVVGWSRGAKAMLVVPALTFILWFVVRAVAQLVLGRWSA